MRIVWRKWVGVVLVWSLVLACVSRPVGVFRSGDVADFDHLRALPVASVHVDPFALTEDIADLKQAFRTEKVLSPKTLSLYDDLLDAYLVLQAQAPPLAPVLIVPPKSQMRPRAENGSAGKPGLL